MGGGVYIASTQNLVVTHKFPNSVRPNSETRSDRFSSKCECYAFRLDRHDQLGLDRCARVRVKPQLSLTDYTNLMWPILVIRKQRIGQANSVGPITYLGATEIIATNTREFASRSRWDRDPIGETKLIRVSGSGYVNELCGAGQIKLVGPSLTLGLGHMWIWESGWGLWSISLSTLSKQVIKQHVIPF